ncbi:hypothetical protein ACF9IK_00055 [Kitasatospora hibisci]|uniref:hypothetical protein n=1 Tax=Kitasatospora hibisci TaxID=3369522 RepID=UPI003754899D
MHVYRSPDRPGGVSRPALHKMLEIKVVELGDHVHGLGRPIHLTDLGQRVVIATKATGQ